MKTRFEHEDHNSRQQATVGSEGHTSPGRAIPERVGVQPFRSSPTKGHIKTFKGIYMKSITGKTSEQLLKTLPDWKRRKFIDFWNVGWRNGSKQQAVVSWDKAIPDPQTAEMVIERANDYEKNCRARDIPKTMASTWLNQARWETVPAPKEEKKSDAKICGCGEEVAILSPEPLCCRCWADKYSTQLFGGKPVHHKQVLAHELKRLDMVPKNGETNESYWDRCRKAARDNFSFGSGGQKSPSRMAQKKGDV